ncbi:hypothetical protein ABT263_28535 [Kitasatospora sp. NPDC001603]|uniref:hypothetical protein n=1 Tax=Kitasatospora sp. NPDC001603 TaxID=3154388 RepID=UPI00332441A9
MNHALLLPVSTPLIHHVVPGLLDAVEQATCHKLGDGKVQRARSDPCEPCPEQLIGELAAEGDPVLGVDTGQAERLGARLLFHLAAPAAPIPQHL